MLFFFTSFANFIHFAEIYCLKRVQTYKLILEKNSPSCQRPIKVE